jgi:formylglycine-generating enzyme required for sulfatase activity
MTYAIKHHARRFTIASLLLAGLVLASSVISHAQQPTAGPNLDVDLPPGAKPREVNSVGMTLAVLDAGAFQMGAPEYVVQVALGGNRFRSGQIFIVDDQAGNSKRFELTDTDTAKKPPFYLPVPFSSGKKTNQPSSPAQIAKNMADAINAQSTAGNLKIAVNVIGTNMYFKGIGLFSAARVNTDNDNRVIVRKPDRYASNDERPQHRTQITDDLTIGVTEVTQQQWNQVMGSNKSTVQGTHLPVNNISYVEAVVFCTKLSDLPAEKAAGRTYRLPTEAEWEYACRAGTNTPYNYGPNASNLKDYGWYRGNTEQIQVVAGKQCNQWGLFDMYGNVSEWCHDTYAAEYYGNAPPENDPTGPTTGPRRVLRGGSFMSQASSCRSSYRGQAAADIESQLNGLRVVCIKR